MKFVANMMMNTPKCSKQAISKIHEKNSKTVNVLTRTPSIRTRSQFQLEQQQSSQTPKHFKEEMNQIHMVKNSEKLKTPSFANKVLNSQLFVKNSQSSSVTNTIKARLAGSARRSLGFLKKACSSSSLNKFGTSRIPRPIFSQKSNIVVNKTENETEVFKQVAEILNNSEISQDDDKVVEVPMQALKILYDTPNRDKILKLLQRTPIVQMDIEADQTPTSDSVPTNTPKSANKKSNQDLLAFETPTVVDKIADSPVADNAENEGDMVSNEEIDGKNEGFEQELANQNQIEVLHNEILVNKTPINIKENENRMFKLIEQQQQQAKKTALHRTSEIISPFGMQNMFKAQQSRQSDVTTPNGVKRTLRTKVKNGENITPYGMKNLFKHHKENNENVNEVMSPYAMKNLFKRHEENIQPGNATTSPYTMKNLFKQHNKLDNEMKATPFTMKNLFKEHKASPVVGDIQATPSTMKNLFKKDSLYNENLSPVALKCLFRNKILNKHNLLNIDYAASPFSMNNLYKENNKKQLSQDMNAILSPTVLTCMFDENIQSPLLNGKYKKTLEATPTEKVGEICDKLVNNELKINQVQDELLKVDNKVLIDCIIGLKQEVKTLENFNEQIFKSIDEAIDEIDEQMSVQYPDEMEVEVEEVILSINQVTPSEDKENNDICNDEVGDAESQLEEENQTYEVNSQEDKQGNTVEMQENIVEEAVVGIIKMQNTIIEEVVEGTVDIQNNNVVVVDILNNTVEEVVDGTVDIQTSNVAEVVDGNADIQTSNVAEVEEEVVTSTNSFVTSQEIEEEPKVSEPVEEIIVSQSIDEEPVVTENEDTVSDSVQEAINFEVSRMQIEKLLSAALYVESIETNNEQETEQKDGAESAAETDELIANESPVEEVVNTSRKSIEIRNDVDLQLNALGVETKESTKSIEVEIPTSLDNEKVTSDSVDSVAKKSTRKGRGKKPEMREPIGQIMSNSMIQENNSIVEERVNEVESERTKETSEEKVTQVEEISNPIPLVESKSKRGVQKSKLAESKSNITDEEVNKKTTRSGRKGKIVPKEDVEVEEQDVQAEVQPEVESEKMEVKKTRGRRAPISKVEDVKTTTETNDSIESVKRPTRKGKAKQSEIVEVEVIHEPEVVTAKPTRQRATRGKKVNNIEPVETIEPSSVADEENISSTESVEPKAKVARRVGRKKVEDIETEKVKASNASQLQEILEVQPTTSKRGRKVAFELSQSEPVEVVEEPKVVRAARGRGKKVIPESEVVSEPVIPKKGRNTRKNKEDEIVELEPESVEEEVKKPVGRRRKQEEQAVAEEPQPAKKLTRATKATKVENEEPKVTRSKRKVTGEEESIDEDTTSRRVAGKGNKKVKL